MAGGSFLRSSDETGNVSSQANALYGMAAQMRSMQRPSYGAYQDALAGSIGGGSSGLTQMFQPIGEALNMTARQLERLTQTMTRSPLMTGTPIGAQMTGMQMLGAAAGFPVAVQGLSPQAASAIAPELMRQNAAVAMSNFGRNFLTQSAPLLAGAAASLMPGGMIWGPAVAAAGQLAAPGLLRMSGADAYLSQAGNARMFQQVLGEQMGGVGTVGRFRASQTAGRNLGEAATDFIREEQKRYGGGFFGMSADAYQPLLATAAMMQSPAEAKQMAEKGSTRLKDQMKALVDVSALLNMTFADVAQLGQQFGAGPDAIGQMRRMVDQVDAAASGGGIQSRAGLMQFGVSMRDRARLLGQGDDAIGSTVSLVGDIARGAVHNVFARGQLEAFGGATTQERAQNMALAMANLGTQLSDTGFGRMLRANVIAGRGTGLQGGLMSAMGTAGAQAINDPFGMILSQADPRTNAMVAGGAPFALIGAMQEAYGGTFGQRGAQAATLQRLMASGLTGVQAGSIMRYHSSMVGRFDKIAGEGQGTGLMAAAAGYSAQTGMGMQDVLSGLASGELSQEQVTSGRVALGRGKLSTTNLSADEIDRRAEAAGSLAITVYERQRDKDRRKRFASGKGGVMGANFEEGMANLFGAAVDYWSEAFDVSGTKDVGAKAEAKERARLQQMAAGQFVTADVAAAMRANEGTLSSLGIDVSSIIKSGDVSTLKTADYKSLGVSDALAGAISGYGEVEGLRGLTSAEDIGTVLDTLNNVLRSQTADTQKELAADPLLKNILSGGISEEELKGNTAAVAHLQKRLIDKGGLATLATTAVLQQANLVNDINRLVGIDSKLASVIAGEGEGAYMKTGPAKGT